MIDYKPETDRSVVAMTGEADNKEVGQAVEEELPRLEGARGDSDGQLQKSKRDLELMVLKYARSERENLTNKSKVEELNKKLKRAIRDNDELANRIKLLTNDKTHLTDTLNAKVAQLTVLEQKNLHLNNTQDNKLKDLSEEVKVLEDRNKQLLAQIESYKSKEGELLDFSERLSMKHMMLQSELDEALKKVPSYREEYELTKKHNEELVEQVKDLKAKIDSLTTSLEEEKKTSAQFKAAKEEAKISIRNVTDELQNEIKVMRRKHQIVLKELTKQIKRLQLNLDESKSQNGNTLEAV